MKLSKNELSETYKKYVLILKENNISLHFNWLLFYPCGEGIPYIIIHENFYEYIVEERNNIVFEKKCYSENELFYEILKYNVKYEYYCKKEIVNKTYKMFSLLNFEWANKFYLSLDDEDKKYISFLDK